MCSDQEESDAVNGLRGQGNVVKPTTVIKIQYLRTAYDGRGSRGPNKSSVSVKYLLRVRLSKETRNKREPLGK